MEKKFAEIEYTSTVEIEYWYNDDWDGEISQADLEHIEESGCREGELITYDNDTETEHYGWWQLS